MNSANDAMNSFRRLRGLPNGEPPIATGARCLVNASNEVVQEAGSTPVFLSTDTVSLPTQGAVLFMGSVTLVAGAGTLKAPFTGDIFAVGSVAAGLNAAGTAFYQIGNNGDGAVVITAFDESGDPNTEDLSTLTVFGAVKPSA